jgi:hypothetical protein
VWRSDRFLTAAKSRQKKKGESSASPPAEDVRNNTAERLRDSELRRAFPACFVFERRKRGGVVAADMSMSDLHEEDFSSVEMYSTKPRIVRGLSRASVDNLLLERRVHFADERSEKGRSRGGFLFSRVFSSRGRSRARDVRSGPTSEVCNVWRFFLTNPSFFQKGRAQVWPGAAALTGTSVFPGKVDVMERSTGRLDFKLSNKLYEQLVVEEDRAAIADEFARVAQAVGYKEAVRTSFHVMVVEPGAVDQAWHYDNDSAVFFLTLLLALTPPNPRAGRTEFLDEEKPMMVSVGSGVAFDGKVYHRGLANRSQSRRIFAYVAATSEEDANDENNDGGLVEPEMVHRQSLKSEGLRIVTNRWYTFQGEGKRDLWPALVLDIFWEKGRKQDVCLSVQWLYRKDQTGIPGAEALCSDPRERFYSLHYDEVQLASCVAKCDVRFLPKSTEKGDFFVRQFFDHNTKTVRPLTRADVFGEPAPKQPVAEEEAVVAVQVEEVEPIAAEAPLKRSKKKR